MNGGLRHSLCEASLSNLLRGQLLFLLRPNPIFTAISRDCGGRNNLGYYRMVTRSAVGQYRWSYFFCFLGFLVDCCLFMHKILTLLDPFRTVSRLPAVQ